MHIDLNEGSYNKHHYEKLDALSDRCIKNKPGKNSLAWPAQSQGETK
jgi:hypothetical protein